MIHLIESPPATTRSRPSWKESLSLTGGRLVRRQHIGPVLRGTNLLSLTGDPACQPISMSQTTHFSIIYICFEITD